MSEKKGWKDLPIGGIIAEAGNSEEYETGSWRTYRPIWDESKCSQCLMCFMFCPDSAIIVEDGKMVGINYFHCKGCGICAEECPDKFKAIEMVLESDIENGEDE
jgi:pyruvate ferredoxin oxidoreductase delta subunit